MVKKTTPKALTAVKGDFIAALQNVVDQGNLLLSALDAALPHMQNSRVRDLIEERTKAFKTALYGEES